MQITQQQIDCYREDGAILLRGVFSDWVERLRAGVARNMQEPGPHGAENVRPGDGGGRFFDDYCNWQRIPEFTDFVLNSPAAAIAGRLMASDAAQIFHDHVLVKEPGTPKRTPWHQDMPYYCVDGMQTGSYWIPLDAVTSENTLRLVLGSHLWPRLVRPKRWAGGEDFYADAAQFMDMPDVEGGHYRILEPALEPGDAILFNFRTVHGANGNAGPARRRAFSCRFLGDDAVYAERPGRTSPPYPGINQRRGERLREDWFPIVWTAA
ncbi:ectoine hydroxylase-related dioxygenase (phytanoyl-CoA dioxygenase family) [Dongia mobilis]|uniref:Ectoine hydroxylase-related dioxygenase (Phytanoyl-CoA dioxygenase family) n=1 Tax=Dongia mobilis TaxID=578943 RepID=A0A4R6WV32_9PROT|nr:phytanoyl-CoA dioxygenase family protein [Dongia mobilis]TDQ83874.1 ectoine hydroxylase-related dioxygenase (phytanoyl-CoA dioxygenase family) [Dongia mobilis]